MKRLFGAIILAYFSRISETAPRRSSTSLSAQRNRQTDSITMKNGDGRERKKFTDSPELLANFCLRELARRWGPAKVGRPASKPLRVVATSDPSSSFESFTDSLAPRVPGPSTFSAECHNRICNIDIIFDRLNFATANPSIILKKFCRKRLRIK